ncbi:MULTISPECIES: methylmalonyl Co-A mutase-associated GTPase MeaB [Spongiibacter]|uniref:methylmalonyl Co-A mutase-associated GTPase MeaB n=1 Tax=Spongiibacter TaxID=630749 RepID=UPI0003B3F0B1|nr:MULTISPECIES: methylmalonyl Co-A mutase-associated GTPase MeaB [Spongiibacter]MAY39311.1 methylmalonyl Co-A mutase-associated GTPase MeaB [Spongiibacter sp.]MBI58979.1 methylmalonyl Co-A mutase-associated GTPase MeaB [Spongiibacter sp.]MBU72546.1 methylmalonyl Co-A mutase-associated GTPase MeaB [Spongiibacter sp.]|tara:strand:- start:1953 stop:2930 length:978 start_codon:yes stop_codon:yes gene_type:complete
MNIDVEALKQGNRRALAKAITLVESKKLDHRAQAQELLEAVLSNTGNSIRIGITGIPGVGKSTFIESFGQYLISQGKRVAVLAVDPSSPIAGGSILGDKTRMEMLSRSDDAFIRPSPSEGSLGGVALKTRETMLLCEAAGYDVILVETVGVGQSEYEVASMVDFFMVLMLPNAGDELQGIKKGIMELADALVINKADGESINLATQTRRHYQNALHLLRHSSFWTPQVMTCSALRNENIQAVWGMISDYQVDATKNGALAEKRARQAKEWMNKLLHEMLDIKLKENPAIKALLPELNRKVTDGETTPFLAAQRIVELLFEGTPTS